MKKLNLILCSYATLTARAVYAHAGHGLPGTIGHDLQHQLWLFSAIVVISALLLLAGNVDKQQD